MIQKVHMYAVRCVIVAVGVACADAGAVDMRCASQPENALLQRGTATMTLEHVIVEESMADGLVDNKDSKILDQRDAATILLERVMEQSMSDALDEKESKGHCAFRNFSKALKPYVLLGPEDAGTNLLERFIEANWPNTFISTYTANALWKHANSGAEDIYRVIRSSGIGDISDLPAVAIVRSPMAQVASWIKQPYDMEACVNRSVTTMASPCFADLQAQPCGHKASHPNSSRLVKFSSVMDVYNKYLQLYDDIARQAVFATFLRIGYEDLVYSPAAVVRLLAHVLGVTAPYQVAIVESPAKTSGDIIHSREEALARLHNRSYLEALGDDVLKTLCPLLNTQLVTGLQEGTFLSEDQHRTLPYTSDCAGLLP
mmetsp:Transcript_58790/g.140135  ORF Transcript_58790/g.140135 Transcript_58790/m.140135 type:complete len:372 (-) Transcript_58790:42-1157(-)